MLLRSYFVLCLIYRTTFAMTNPHVDNQTFCVKPFSENSVSVATTLRCRICQYNDLSSSILRNDLWITNPTAFHECSLFQLVNRSPSFMELVDDLFQPAHLSCSLFRIVMNINFHDKTSTQSMAMSDILDCNNSNIYALRAKLELDWIVHVVKACRTTLGVNASKLNKMLDTDLPLENVDCISTWILNHVSKRLPYFCVGYIEINLGGWNFEQHMPDLSTHTCTKILLKNLVNNPYLLYIQSHSKMPNSLTQYNNVRNNDEIMEEIDGILINMYKANNIVILETDVLQSILIIQILTSQLKYTFIESRKSISWLFKRFKLDTSPSNWISLVYKIGEIDITNDVFILGHKKQKFDKFIKYYESNKTNISERFIIFFIAKIVLYAPFDHVVRLCCCLFYKNLIENFSIWMTLRYSIFIKLLTNAAQPTTNQNDETNCSSWNATSKLKYWSTSSSVNFIKDVHSLFIPNSCENIKHKSFSLRNIEALTKVHNFLISIYFEIERLS